MTCYLAKVPAQHLGLAFDVLSDMVLEPILAPEELEKERGVIIEEIKMYKDQPQSYVFEILDGLLWPGHPLGMCLSGDIDSVCRINRQELFKFRSRYYTAPNMAVVACGNLSSSEFTSQVNRRFNRFCTAGKNRFLRARRRQTKPRVKIFFKETEQTHLALGFEGLKRSHKDRYALYLLHIILGANMSSRLFNEVREKRGLAYRIGTQVKFFADTGAFIIQAGIDNKKVALAVKIILQQLRKIATNMVSSDELERAKEFFSGQLRLSLEDTLEHMLWAGESVLALGKVYTLEQVLREIAQVNKEDLLRISRQVLSTEKANLALIGPLKNKEKELYGYLNCA
jgi:predicted Zn-dependent peptidase